MKSLRYRSRCVRGQEPAPTDSRPSPALQAPSTAGATRPSVLRFLQGCAEGALGVGPGCGIRGGRGTRHQDRGHQPPRRAPPARLSFSSTWTDPPGAPGAESRARQGPRRRCACAEGAPRSPRELVDYRVRERRRPPRRRRRRRRGCTELGTRYARPGSEAPNPAPHLELKTAVGVRAPFSAGERVIRAQRAVTAPVPRCLALRLGG